MNTSVTLQLLKQIPYFASLPDSEGRELPQGYVERRCQAGEVIFLKGDPCQGLCIVLSGRVRTVTRSVEGRERVLKCSGRAGRPPMSP
jgi:CRP/FNR family transcriptional regulator, dissimilatory nitrate respiration regulator